MSERPPTPSPSEPAPQDAELLRGAILEAAAIARRQRARSVAVWRKPGNEPVCDADIAVNRYLQETITAARPWDGWLSEENPESHDAAQGHGATGRVWIVDPIDGTRAFLRGGEDFAVSVALAIGGRPALAALAQPMTGELYFAQRGGGATLDGQRIHVGGRDRLEGCRIAADEAFFRAKRHWPVPWPEMDYCRIGSIALRIAYVAAGRLDAAVSQRPKAHWDLAAAQLILEEAGGNCVDQRGAALDYAQSPPIQPCFAAAPKPLIGAILTRLAPAMRQRRSQINGTRENPA